MNYQELADAARTYADRNDFEVIDNIDTFIIMAEARMNRVLKTRKQSNRAYTPTVEGQEYYSLPPDYAGIRDIQINSDLPDVDHKTVPCHYLNPELFNIKANEPYGGKTYYTIIADQFQIYPKQSAGKTIEIVYYQKVPPLTATNFLNWMSQDHPDIYLSGIITEIELFVKNYETANLWDARMNRAIEELDNADIKERWSGSQLVTRVG